jgi:hypothetical protein
VRTRFNAKLCLTTTPSRLRTPWVVKNIRDLTLLNGHDGVVLSVPDVLRRTGEPYVVPEELLDVPGLEILRCQDEGPGTKLLAPLRSNIPDSTILMICDDDTRYFCDVFYRLALSVAKAPHALHCNCLPRPVGFAGYGSTKATLLPILRLEHPDVCWTVDDDYFDAAFSLMGLEIRVVESPLGKGPMCVPFVVDVVQTGLMSPQFREGSLLREEKFLNDARLKKTQSCWLAVTKQFVPPS